jgi:lipopolysaccharide biosynthesis glycosyltransferase
MSKSSPIPVAFAINDPYLNPLLVVLVSMFEHAHADTVYAVHVINYKLKPETRQQIEQFVDERHPQSSVTFLDLSDEQWQQVPAVGGFYGKEANYRLLLPDLLPNVERIIYMDVDVLVLGDLAQLFNFNMNGQAVLLVCDSGASIIGMERTVQMAKFFSITFHINDRMMYGNSGVMLINLTLWYKLNWLQKGLTILDTAPSSLLKYPDQTVINYLAVCDGQYGTNLPLIFNAFPYDCYQGTSGKVLLDKKRYSFFIIDQLVQEQWKNKEEVCILHFAGSAPWKVENRDIGLRDLYIKYASKIGWTLFSPPRTRIAIAKQNLKHWVRVSGKKVLAAVGFGFLFGLIIASMACLIIFSFIH